MNLDSIKSHLRTPLFTLYKVKDINDIQLNEMTSKRMKKIFNLERRKEIYNSLEWAEKNSNFDFENIMENTPVTGELIFSNQEVFEHLMNYKSFMENETYGLLTEDLNPMKF